MEASNIARHLKFSNFNEPIPFEIAQLFTNPMHYVTIVLLGIMIIYFVYKIFQNYIDEQLMAKLPNSIAVHIPSAPPAYVHKDPHSLPMVNFT